MPVEDDHDRWRELAERAEEIAEKARHDPYDPQLTGAMRALVHEAHARYVPDHSATDVLETCASQGAAHAAFGEAWLALRHSKQALAEFDKSLEVLGRDSGASAGDARLTAHARCGRGMCLVALQRSGEAIPSLDASIDWYTTQGDLTDETQQSRLSQALHTLAMAHDDAGDLPQAVALTVRAVDWRRRLVERNPERYRLALSRSLRNLGDGLIALGRHDEVLPIRTEMLELRREEWRETRSVAAALALAQAAEIVSREWEEAADSVGALSLAQEAVAIHRELDAKNSLAFKEGLLQSLDNLRAAFARDGRHADAQRLAQEASELTLDLPSHDQPVPAAEQARWLQPQGAKPIEEEPNGTAMRARAIEACAEAQRLAAAAEHVKALDAAQAGVEWARRLWADSPEAGRHVLAWGLNVLGLRLNQIGRHDDALRTFQESLVLCRELSASDRSTFLPDLAVSLHNTGDSLTQAGRHSEALQALEDAVALRRDLVAPNREACLSELAASLSTLGGRFSREGAHVEALRATQEAVDLRRELVGHDRETFLRSLAATLYNLAARYSHAGHPVEALRAADEAVELFRELASRDRDAFSSDLASSLFAKGCNLAALRRAGLALEAYAESVSVLRQLPSPKPEFDLGQLGRSLNNLGLTLSELGRKEEALRAIEEAVDVRNELVSHDRDAFVADLAESLHNLGNVLSDLSRNDEALLAAQTSVMVLRDLVTRERIRGLPYLMQSVNNLALRLDEVGRESDALLAAQEAVSLARELVEQDRPRFLHRLAVSLVNLSLRLVAAERRSEAISAAQSAVELYRELQPDAGSQFYDDYVASLYQLGFRHAEVGMWLEAKAALRDCAVLLLQTQPTYPHRWATMARGTSRLLDSREDLRRWHLPVLRQLTTHRELAWDSAHGTVFLRLQVDIAAQIWRILSSLSVADGDLLDEAVAVLIATLQSPDLSRWLEVRGAGDGPLTKLAELKREVIEAEQLLAALRTGSNGGDNDAGRAALSSPNHEVLAPGGDDIEEQAARVQALRQAFRDERSRMVIEDPRFAAAFEPLGAQALRLLARHAHGGALLCVLHLGAGAPPEAPLAERSRTVAALLHADGQPTQLLELAGAWEVASHAQQYQPEEHGVARRGPLRSARALSAGPASGGGPLPPSAELLAQHMASSFWEPLQRALWGSGVTIDRLHICLHGTCQQLPLATRSDRDCPGLRIVAWPGLPYLRRAAASTPSAIVNDEFSPWVVGHDCAWETEQPLPMVAVEAALLCSLLSERGQLVRAVNEAVRLHEGASAFVACCHGGTERAQFDHALHLGKEPLTVRWILQRHIGPPLTLLPACYAGRTDEDAAGNALGVAAAFMLSGTKVVVASSKAVPDLLQPWLSTLVVWHAMQGLSHHAASHVARDQFARLEFPDGYRDWLRTALPHALASIQPGGEEDRRIRGPRAQLALETVARCWPWEGETQHLFSADAHLRAEATRSVVAGILKPRAGENGARDLAAEAREVAAFVFIYGTD